MAGSSLYGDGALYERLASTGDVQPEVAFYSALAPGRQPAQVLELACGTGRLSLPLSKAGFQVTGIDNSESMLAVARAEADASATFLLADVRDFNVGCTFPLIIFPNNSIGHLLTARDLNACLDRVSSHLQADGLFVVDTFNPALELLSRDPHTRYPVTTFATDGGERVTVSETSEYDPAAHLNHLRWYFAFSGGREVECEFELRIFFPRELDALLDSQGFAIVAKYGSFARESFAVASRHQLIVCRRRDP